MRLLDEETHAEATEIGAQVLKGLRDDLPFFGGCGFLVGFLAVVQERIREAGWGTGKPWTNELASDFLSLQAFMLVFIGLAFVSGLRSLLEGVRPGWPRLATAVEHIRSRLLQISTPSIAFMLGLVINIAIRSFLNVRIDGLGFISSLLILAALLVIACGVGLYIAKKSGPLDNLAGGSVMVVASAIAFGWLLLRGV